MQETGKYSPNSTVGKVQGVPGFQGTEFILGMNNEKITQGGEINKPQAKNKIFCNYLTSSKVRSCR